MCSCNLQKLLSNFEKNFNQNFNNLENIIKKKYGDLFLKSTSTYKPTVGNHHECVCGAIVVYISNYLIIGH